MLDSDLLTLIKLIKVKINNKILTKILKDIKYKRFKLPIFEYVNGSELIIIEKN